MIENFLFSVVAGFVSSISVVLFLYLLRPKIEISGEISKKTNEETSSYGFKIVNKTKFPIYDVQVILELISPRSVSGGQINSTLSLKLKRDLYFLIHKFNKSDPVAEYAFRVRTNENLHEKWASEGQYLRLTVFARHSLSGFSSVTRKSFFSKADIKSGSHQFGVGMQVHPMD